MPRATAGTKEQGWATCGVSTSACWGLSGGSKHSDGGKSSGTARGALGPLAKLAFGVARPHSCLPLSTGACFGANRPSPIRSPGASVTAGVGLTFIARAAKLFGVGLTFIVGAGILLPEEVLIFEKRTWEKVQRSTCFCSRVLVLRYLRKP